MREEKNGNINEKVMPRGLRKSVPDKTKHRKVLLTSPESVAYKNILDGMLEGCQIIDYTWRYLYVNDAAAQHGHRRKEELLGHTMMETYPGIENTPMFCKLRLCMEKRINSRITNEFTYTDGSKGWFDLSIKPVPQGIFVLSIDITEITAHKYAEASLIKANRALKVLSALNEILVHVGDESQLLNEVCRVIVEIGGYRMAWVGFINDTDKIVRPVAQAGFEDGYLNDTKITWDDSATGRGPSGRALRTGKPVICENTLTDPLYAPWRNEAIKRQYCSTIALPLKENERVWGTLNIYSADDRFNSDEIKLLAELADNVVYGIQAIRTRQEHAQAMNALEDSEARYRTLFESATEGIFIRNPDTRIFRYVNPAFCHMLGYTKEELTTMDFLDVHPEDAHGMVLADTASKSKGESAFSNEVPFRRKDGGILFMNITVADIILEGKPYHMVFCTDVTERKRAAEAETLNAQNLLSSLEATVLAMASTIETRDPYTSGHQQRVTELAVAISKAMALSDNVIQGIRMAGIVHDIGKITVPAEILNKPGELNPIELSLIKMHSRRGYEMLQKIEFPWPIAKIVLQHHERLNGSGYPDHISGSDILPEARIIAVADVVEAMASHRPYRAALGIEAALEEISLNKVTLYDPAVVETCLKLFAAGFTFTTVA